MKFGIIGMAATAAATLMATGATQAETRTLDLPPFTGVDISSGINAEVTIGAEQSVEIEAPEAESLERMQVRVVNGTLQASIDWSIFDLFGDWNRQAKIRITAPEINSLEASSGAYIVAAEIAGDKLTFSASSGASVKATGVTGETQALDASSGASIEVDGACAVAEIDVSSGADISAEELLCADIVVRASSGAHAAVFASKSAKAEASSGGGIVVYGNPPTFEQDTSSGGDVEAGK
jgi:hypothetical protein